MEHHLNPSDDRPTSSSSQALVMMGESAAIGDEGLDQGAPSNLNGSRNAPDVTNPSEGTSFLPQPQTDQPLSIESVPLENRFQFAQGNGRKRKLENLAARLKELVSGNEKRKKRSNKKGNSKEKKKATKPKTPQIEAGSPAPVEPGELHRNYLSLQLKTTGNSKRERRPQNGDEDLDSTSDESNEEVAFEGFGLARFEEEKFPMDPEGLMEYINLQSTAMIARHRESTDLSTSRGLQFGPASEALRNKMISLAEALASNDEVYFCPYLPLFKPQCSLILTLIYPQLLLFYLFFYPCFTPVLSPFYPCLIPICLLVSPHLPPNTPCINPLDTSFQLPHTPISLHFTPIHLYFPFSSPIFHFSLLPIP